MSLRKLKKSQLYLIISALFAVILLIFYIVYSQIVSPLEEKIQKANQQYTNNQKLADLLQSQVDDTLVKVDSSTISLQERIPVDPMLERFILDIEKAEIVSDSLVTNMDISIEEMKKQEGNAKAPKTEQEDQQPENTIPEGLDRLVVKMEVESPDYYAMEEFLATLEGIKRITKVDVLEFKGKGEDSYLEEEEDEVQILNYSLTLSTFFYPKLQEIKDHLPPFEIPDPSYKDNPLFIKNYSKPQEPITKDDEYILYDIKPGDTLSEIAERFYKDWTKYNLIQKANNIKGDLIISGARLKIPNKNIFEFKAENKAKATTVPMIEAVVSRVIDGDTVEVDLNGKEETVRLLLVDTPETVHPNLPVQKFGPEASKFTKEILAVGKTVYLEYDGPKRDQYDRLLAYLWVDGEIFNEMLLENGLARLAYVYDPPYTHYGAFVKAQTKAVTAKKGIWSIPGYVTEDGFSE